MLDTIIHGSFADPLQRPHQLFLTGDQIYADDVAAPLLEQLSAIGKDLLWTPEETVPPRETGGAAPTADQLAPGVRDELVCPPMTSDAAACHLIRLGEFYAMYLFGWSDALWSDFTARPVPDPPLPTGPVSMAESQAKIDAAKNYNQPIPSLGHFRDGLGKVRRALANVPTYMIFDDHEVTDDWYLHLQMRENVLESPLGRRILTNALCAYCVFQGWGNTPELFGAGAEGGLFLSSLSQWRGQESDSQYGDMCIALGTAVASSPPQLRFDYAAGGPAHDVIVLDTRTRRGYPSEDDKGQADLVPAAELQIQIGNRIPSNPASRKPLTILISAAPVFGDPLVEWGQELAGHFQSATSLDRETWLIPSRRQGFEQLLAALVPCGSTLILSGDVHYAFTCGIRYWDDRTSPGNRAAFVQLVASALKNQSGAGGFLGSKAPPSPQVFLGWTSPGEHLTAPTDFGPGSVQVIGTPAVRRLRTGDTIVDPPQWRYRAGWVKDTRPFADRTGLPAFTPSGGSWLDAQRELAAEHRRASHNDQMRCIVGNNNIAMVRFAATAPGAPRPMIVVEQSLWYRVSESDDGLPNTIHWADLSPPAADDPKPVAPGSIADPPATAAGWADLVSFRPPTALQTSVKARKFRFQPIESAWGEYINLDRYPVRVSVLPTVAGVQLDAKGLLRRIRDHLNDLIDTGYSEFAPYEAADTAAWASASPLGAALDIQMKVAGNRVDHGVIVVTETADDHWTFSTAWSPRDWNHPVSGNRQFGYVVDGGSYVFFTRGADRTSNLQFDMGSSVVFGAAHGLWLSLQAGLAEFVNDNQGAAVAEAPVWNRYLWTGVKANYYNPTVAWLP